MQLTYGSQAESSQVIFQFGGIQGDYLKAYPTNLWRLISPIFVHIGWEHFLLNGLALYFVGQMGESIWGSLRFLILYILSGLMGNIFTLFLLHMWWQQEPQRLYLVFFCYSNRRVFWKKSLFKTSWKIISSDDLVKFIF